MFFHPRLLDGKGTVAHDLDAITTFWDGEAAGDMGEIEAQAPVEKDNGTVRVPKAKVRPRFTLRPNLARDPTSARATPPPLFQNATPSRADRHADHAPSPASPD